MARDRLTALQVKRAHEKGEPVLLPDGAGLYLRKQSASGTAWTLRYRFGGRDRWMALGSYPDMELADARRARRHHAGHGGALTRPCGKEGADGSE
jgi:hypothetical protein